MPVQAVIFDRDKWGDIFSAHQWLLQHGIYPVKMPHITDNFIRFRISNPKRFNHFITKKIGHGIELIIGFY